MPSFIVFDLNASTGFRVVDVDQLNAPTFVDDDFAGSGALGAHWLTFQEADVPGIARVGGRFQGDVITNPGNSTEWFNDLNGRSDYQNVNFPSVGFDEYIVRNIGISPQGQPTLNLVPNGGFAFCGLMVRSVLGWEFSVVGHRGGTTATVEVKSTTADISSVIDEGANVFGPGVTHGDLRLRLYADGTVEFAYSVAGANSWTLVNGGTGLTPVSRRPVYDGSETVELSLIMYAEGDLELPFTGSVDSIAKTSAIGAETISADLLSPLPQFSTTVERIIPASAAFSQPVQQFAGLLEIQKNLNVSLNSPLPQFSGSATLTGIASLSAILSQPLPQMNANLEINRVFNALPFISPLPSFTGSSEIGRKLIPSAFNSPLPRFSATASLVGNISASMILGQPVPVFSGQMASSEILDVVLASPLPELSGLVLTGELTVSVMRVNFSVPILFDDHSGVSFKNETTGEIVSVTSDTVSPSQEIVYEAVWGQEILPTDIIKFLYDPNVGNYRDGSGALMENHLVFLKNNLV